MASASAAQHAVAVAVAVGVVEQLEAVDVAHDHGRGRPPVRAGQGLVEGRVVAEAGERVGLGALAQRAQQLGGAQAGGAVGGELLEQLDVVGADGRRLVGDQHEGAQQLAVGEEADRDQRLDPRGAQLGQVGRRRRLGLADGEERDPVLDPRPDRVERRGPQDLRQRAGRDRRPQGAAGAGRAREQHRAQRDEVERGAQQRVGDRCRVLQVGDVGDVAQQALHARLAGQPAELLDARAEGAGALAQVVEVAVAQRLARFDVEHADGQAAGAQGEARLGHDPRVGLEVVLACADVLDDHLGPLAVRAPHDPGTARQPVAGLPVAVQGGAPQASAAGEVDRGQEPLLAPDVVDHRRRGGGGVRGSLERQAQQGGGQAHH